MNELTVKLHALRSVLRLNRDTLADLESKLKEKQAELDSFELDNDDYVESYEDMLNDCYGEFMNIQASRILKRCDEVAYRCGLNDFVDGMDKTDDPAYKAIEEEIEELENGISDIESQIEEIEEQISDIESDIETTNNSEDN